MIIAAKAATGASTLPYQWIAVGASGNLATSTSTTASSWTARTSSFGTTVIYNVKSNTSQYVAVGGTGKLATSSDGITWTQQTSSFGTSAILSVCFGNGIWVASGNDGKLATSTDGITWTQRTTGHSAATGVYTAFGDGVFVSVGTGGAIFTATDPTGTWTSRTSTQTLCTQPPRYAPSFDVWTSGFDGGTATGQIQTSADGLTWTSRNLPNSTVAVVSYFAGAFVNNASVMACFYQTGATTWDIATSTDGVTWTDRTPAVTNQATYVGATDENGFMVLGAGANTVQTSSDGTTWTSRTGPTFASNAICHSAASFGG